MKRFKSRLVLLLALVMILTVALSACGKAEDTGSTTTEGTTTVASGETTTVALEKEIMEISVALWDLAEFGNDPIGQKIMDDLKIKINVVPMGWDDAEEKVKLWAASQSLPDLVAADSASDLTRFYSWIDQGVIRKIPEDKLASYPYVKATFDNCQVAQTVKEIKGGYYFIPRPQSVKNYYVAAQQVMYYRMDWLANVGITVLPKTWDDLYNMFKAFTLNDPDQNGVNDTYGITFAGSLDKVIRPFFVQANCDPESWMEEEGKWIPGYSSKNNIEVLTYFRKLADEGLIDPEFPMNGWKQATQKFAMNTVGTLYRAGDVRWMRKTILDNYGAANPDVDPLTTVGVLSPFSKDATSQPMWQKYYDMGGTEISAMVDDAKMERILELFNYMLTPVNYERLRFGVEGTDYVKENGIIKQVLDVETGKGVNMAQKYPSSAMNILTDWGLDIDIESSVMKQSMRDLSQKVRDEFNPIAVESNLKPLLMSTPAKDKLIPAYDEAFVNIIFGDAPVDQMFNEYVEQLNGQGLQDAINEVTAAMAK